MKIVLSLISFIFLINSGLEGQGCKNRYKSQLEEGSKIIDCGYHFTLEKSKNTEFIYKVFYPETKALTHYTTFKSKKYKVKHGLFKHFYDDGTLASQGVYENDEKEGFWVENENEEGNYVKGQREGQWKTYNADRSIRNSKTYKNGLLEGDFTIYTEDGAVEKVIQFKEGKRIIDQDNSNETEIEEEFPLFPGCTGLNLSGEFLKKCAERKMLQYVYSGIKYPPFPRENGIEGKALFRFTVDKDGSIIDIQTLNGVCKDIEKECMRILHSMPKWIPGKQRGEPVKVLFTLPITFRLQ